MLSALRIATSSGLPRMTSALPKASNPFWIVSQRTIVTLPKLHYELKDLVSTGLFSAKAIDYHFNYIQYRDVKKANQIIEVGYLRGRRPDTILREIGQDDREPVLFNALGSAWNHDHFWFGMTPGGVAPSEALLEAFKIHFGGFDKFQQKFIEVAQSIQGSGWVWLISRDGHLDILPMFNSNTPGALPQDSKINPLLCADVWEHAYYLDYGPEVDDYLKKWFEQVDWEFVEYRYAPTLALARKVQERRRINLLPQLNEEVENVQEKAIPAKTLAKIEKQFAGQTMWPL
eukprot:TRINITY_DN7629_c0_g1_i1.p1 TRINITY_DN7629_c0_g1~~TRINITY_DN7629_c0_g1_i1.p1  ORF type:complete len:300 (-),score=71.96 TRINITY_DN7629_c0_g1_i1:37-900(-)